MSGEQYRWKSVTAYVDIETGEQIDKTEIGINYTKVGLIDSTIRIDNELFTKTNLRTVGVTKIQHKQLTLF